MRITLTPSDAAWFIYKVLHTLPELHIVSINVFHQNSVCKIYFIFDNEPDKTIVRNRVKILGGEIDNLPEANDKLGFSVCYVNKEAEDDYWDSLYLNEPTVTNIVESTPEEVF